MILTDFGGRWPIRSNSLKTATWLRPAHQHTCIHTQARTYRTNNTIWTLGEHRLKTDLGQIHKAKVRLFQLKVTNRSSGWQTNSEKKSISKSKTVKPEFCCSSSWRVSETTNAECVLLLICKQWQIILHRHDVERCLRVTCNLIVADQRKVLHHNETKKRERQREAVTVASGVVFNSTCCQKHCWSQWRFCSVMSCQHQRCLHCQCCCVTKDLVDGSFWSVVERELALTNLTMIWNTFWN